MKYLKINTFPILTRNRKQQYHRNAKYLEINSTKKTLGLKSQTNNNTAWNHVKNNLKKSELDIYYSWL